MRARLVTLLVLVLAQRSLAEPVVMFVETKGAPPLPTLVSQVELHADRDLAVITHQEPDVDPFGYADAASQLVATGAATIVVWVAPIDQGFLVFAAGGWPGRALIELVRVERALGSAELERTIALKIAGLLDALLAPRASVRAVILIATPPAPEWRVEIDAIVAREAHERGIDGRGAIGVARAWWRGSWLVAPLISAHWQPSAGIERTAGRVWLSEVGGSLACELGRQIGSRAILLRPRLVGAAVLARGATDDGRHGDAVLFAPYAGIEAGVRQALSDVFSIGVVAGADVALHHHELLIDGQTIVDIGRARLHVGLSFTVAL